MSLKSFARRIPLYINVLLTVALLLSSWLPYMSPKQFLFGVFLGWAFPILWCINLLFIPYWIVKKKRFFWLPVFGLLLSFKATHDTFGISPVQDTTRTGKFTLMTFNSSSMGLKEYKEDSLIKERIYKTLKKASPDILCVQEFYTNTRKGFSDHITGLQQKLNYPYYSFTDDKTRWDTWHYGIILFSRYPVLKAKKILCGKNDLGSGSSVLQADILVHGDTIRVLTAQLKSYMLQLNKPNVLAKVRGTIYQRADQAPLLAALVSESPYPVVVCGDFNDTPVSYSYGTVSKGMQDALLKRGWGIGRTLSFLSPTLRIDYIFAQSSFNIHTYNTFREKGFEHFPVIAGLSVKRN